MPASSYEIRICRSCALRYPLVDARTFGTRCPACLGTTRLVLRRKLLSERTLDRSEISQCETVPDSSNAREQSGSEMMVLLDNIRSARNVGSIFRSADGFGFTGAHLCGITATPYHAAVRKTSLGAEQSVIWSYHKDAVILARGLKEEGWRLFALEDDSRAIPITGAAPATGRAMLIVGNEVTGVDPELLDLSDRIFCIPMRGQKRSLNVSAAFAVAAYALSQE